MCNRTCSILDTCVILQTIILNNMSYVMEFSCVVKANVFIMEVVGSNPIVNSGINEE